MFAKGADLPTLQSYMAKVCRDRGWDQADDREVVCIAISDFDGSGGGAAEGTDGTEAE